MKLCFFKSSFPWRRCPILREKIKIQRILRVSSAIQNRVQKGNDQYFRKGVETLLNTEITHIPILMNFEEIYLIDELIDFILYYDELKKIHYEKYRIKVIIYILQIIMKRIFVPFLINIFLSYLNKQE